MHFVVGDNLLVDRAEGPQPDVQKHLRDFRALIPNFPKELFGEMQSRRRSGRRTVHFAVYRIVSALIFELLLDIRRKGHRTDAGENILKYAVERKIHNAFSRFGDPLDGQGKLVIYFHFRADFSLFPGPHQYFPFCQIVSFEKQHLHNSPMLGQCIQSGGNDLGIIYHENVPGADIIDNIPKNFVLRLFRLSIID